MARQSSALFLLLGLLSGTAAVAQEPPPEQPPPQLDEYQSGVDALSTESDSQTATQQGSDEGAKDWSNQGFDTYDDSYTSSDGLEPAPLVVTPNE